MCWKALVPARDLQLPGGVAALRKWAVPNHPYRALAPAVACVAALLAACVTSTPIRTLPGELRTGDLIFLDLDAGPLCDAIEEVTLTQFGVAGPRLSHVGLIDADGEHVMVLEAWPPRGVQSIPLRQFLDRVPAGEGCAGGFHLRRLPAVDAERGKRAAERLRRQIGRAYDEVFVWGDDRFYCSELIQLGYPELAPRPMYYGATGSAVRSVWERYFAALGTAVPEGRPGISPLGIYVAFPYVR